MEWLNLVTRSQGSLFTLTVTAPEYGTKIRFSTVHSNGLSRSAPPTHAAQQRQQLLAAASAAAAAAAAAVGRIRDVGPIAPPRPVHRLMAR